MKKNIFLIVVWFFLPGRLLLSEEYLQWSYTTELPGSSQFWVGNDAVDGVGGSFWVRYLNGGPSIILWLAPDGIPIATVELSSDYMALELVHFSSNRAVVASSTSLEPKIVIQLEKNGDSISRNEYPYEGTLYSNLPAGSDSDGFFTTEMVDTTLTVHRYSFSPLLEAPILLFKLTDQNVDFSWQSEEGVLYRMEASNNLDEWREAGNPVLGDGQINTLNIKLDQPVTFFRLRGVR